MSSLIHACIQFEGDPSVRRLRVLAGTARLYPVFQRLGSQFSAATGIPLYFNFSTTIGSSAAAMRAAIAAPPPVLDTNDSSGGMDAIIAAPSFMPLMDSAGKLLDLSKLVESDLQLKWFEIGSMLRSQMVVYGAKVVAIPVTTSPSFLFYHAPTFQRDGLVVPVTWDQALALAEKYNGKDINGDGKPDYGVCMSPPNCFVDGALLQFILPSFVQTRGSSQGLFVDPASMANLANTSAMAEALMVLRRLRLAGPRFGDCSVFEDAEYLRGRCLLSITSPTTFKTAYSPDAPAEYAAMRGNMGITAFPGSTRVLDRTTGQMVDCNETTCPMARAKTLDSDGVLRPVNQPVPSNNVIVMINAQSPPKYQFYAYSLFSYLTSPQVLGTEGAALLLDPRLETAPLRNSDLTRQSAALWVARGYHPSDVEHFFTAYRAALENPNQAYEPRFPGNLNITQACRIAAILYTNTTPGYQPPPMAVPVGMIARAVAAVVAENGGPDAFASVYRQTLNWAPPPPAALSPELNDGGSWTGSNDGKDSRRKRITALAVAVPGGVTLVIVVVLVMVTLLRRGRAHRGHGAVQAPGAGPDSTLLVTDIQSSTSLWEHLDAGVMDQALQLHHAVLRTAIADWGGYESATEGDSFIVAFPNPTAALGCALAAQQALVDAPWPPGLLDYPPLPGLEGDDDPLLQVAALPLARPPKGAVRTPRSGGGSGARDAPPPSSPNVVLRLGPEAPLPSQRVAQWRQGGQGCAPVLARILPPWCGDRPGDQEGVLKGAQPFTQVAQVPVPAGSAAQEHIALGVARSFRHGASGTLEEDVAAEAIGSPDGTWLASPLDAAAGERTSGSGNVRAALEEAIGDTAPDAGRLLKSGPDPHVTALSSADVNSQVTTTLSLATSIRASFRFIHGVGASVVGPPFHPLPSQTSGNALAPAPSSASLKSINPNAPAPAADSVTLFRGLRVRMGMWTGIGSAADVSVNAATCRTQYSGECMRLAKAVADTAHGGMVVFTEASRRRFEASAIRSSKHVLLYGGLHNVDVGGKVSADRGGPPQLHIYTAYSRRLLPRAVVVRPLRTAGELRPGALAAPVGHGALVQMAVVGATTLWAWDSATTAMSLERLHAAALALLPAPSGSTGSRSGRAYVSAGHVTLLPQGARMSTTGGRAGAPAAVPGVMAVVFADADGAVSWAAAVRRAALELEWPPELLEHELAEEVWASTYGNAGFGDGFLASAPKNQSLPAVVGTPDTSFTGPDGSCRASAPLSPSQGRSLSGRQRSTSSALPSRLSRFGGGGRLLNLASGAIAAAQRASAIASGAADSIGQNSRGAVFSRGSYGNSGMPSPSAAPVKSAALEAAAADGIVALPPPRLLQRGPVGMPRPAFDYQGAASEQTAEAFIANSSALNATAAFTGVGAGVDTSGASRPCSRQLCKLQSNDLPSGSHSVEPDTLELSTPAAAAPAPHTGLNDAGPSRTSETPLEEGLHSPLHLRVSRVTAQAPARASPAQTPARASPVDAPASPGLIHAARAASAAGLWHPAAAELVPPRPCRTPSEVLQPDAAMAATTANSEVLVGPEGCGASALDGQGSRVSHTAGGTRALSRSLLNVGEGSGTGAHPQRTDSEPVVVLRLLYRGLRLRWGVACGQLKGGLAAGDVSGQVSYGGKAAVAAAKLASRARAGQICATAELARTLPAALSAELTIIDKP